MKKLLYICRTNLNGIEEPGVVKKVLGQMRALCEMGFVVDSIHTDEQQVYYNTVAGHETFPAFHTINTGRSLRTAFSYLTRGWKGAIKFEELYNEIDFSSYDIVYFRYYFANKRLVDLFNYLKKIKPSIRIILELPAYPYHIEMLNLTGGIAHRAIDSFWAKKLHKTVDLIVTFSNDTSIFGISAVPITNGIDPTTFKIKPPTPLGDELRIIGVGNISPWHGYDRLIKGMKKIKLNSGSGPRIKFYIVGTGLGLPDLQALVTELEMEGDIIFLGQKNKAELEVLYQDMHMGVGSLGLFRNNLALSSSLKHREYTAVGLPFVLATPDPDFPDGLFFIHYVPNDETIIDMHDILKFYNALSGTHRESLSIKINQYAKDNLSWLQRMKTIIGKLPTS